MSEAYESAGRELVRRILALLPEHPEIREMEDPGGLRDIPGFRCDDIRPSDGMIRAALEAAQAAADGRERPCG